MDETATSPEDTRPWQPGTTSRWSWYRGLGSPSRVLAPMVDQSEPAFRELCRRHGCDLTYYTLSPTLTLTLRLTLALALILTLTPSRGVRARVSSG